MLHYFIVFIKDKLLLPYFFTFLSQSRIMTYKKSALLSQHEFLYLDRLVLKKNLVMIIYK